MGGRGVGETPGAAPLGNRIEGVVTRIIFTSPETQYTVAALEPAGGKKGREVVVVGTLGALHPQQVLSATGEWVEDSKHGRQFKVHDFEVRLPDDAGVIEKFLGGGLIPGIGPKNAKRLVEAFGREVLEVIEKTPERLREVRGIGPALVQSIRAGWEEHRAMRDIMLFLRKYEIPAGFAGRIYRQYGEKAIEQIQRNPYQLALDVRGIGFASADLIAQRLGVPHESIERLKAGVFYQLQDLAGAGHVCFPADPLIERSSAALKVEVSMVVQAVNGLAADGHAALDILPDETRAVYLKSLFRFETETAQAIARLVRAGKLFPKFDAVREVAGFEERFKFRLADAQRIAVCAALDGGVLVITGGPGTGKTTIIRAILDVLARAGVSFLLAAPTGRAARRMQEVTGKPAGTIHRLLKYSGKDGGYQHNSRDPLKADFIIVDEASMIDIALMHALARAVAPTSSLLLVGDVDQLPSVGPGNVLLDLIRSGVVRTVRLNEVFRQAQSSLIVTNAHRVNRGESPVLPEAAPGRAREDFLFVSAEEPEHVVAAISRLMKGGMREHFGLDPADVQVLSPMHRGIAGAQNLNRVLQGLLNGHGPSLERAGRLLRKGDRVMQTSNNYDKDVFNGDVGTVAELHLEGQAVRVSFEGQMAYYERGEIEELELAYAMTIHKSQGSEYAGVIIPVHTTHYVMLHRNLLYTAMTRGKRAVVLVGQKKAIHLAVKNAQAEPRWSALDQRLRRLLGESAA